MSDSPAVLVEGLTRAYGPVEAPTWIVAIAAVFVPPAVRRHDRRRP